MSSIELMEAFDFSSEELRVNRAGQLSARQKAILEREDLQQTIDLGCVLVIFAIVGGLLFGACALLFNVDALLQSIENILPFLVGGGGLFIVATVVVNIWGNIERRRQSLPDVLMVEGQITINEDEGGFNARHYLAIGDKTFRIQASMYDTLKVYKKDTAFRVYYARKLDRILSIEAEMDALPEGDTP
jgi:hypothetical protein